MKMRMVSGLVLSTAFVLGGCVNTPQYSLVKDGDEAQKAGMFDQVSYRIYLEPNFRTPECVAVLPLEVAPEASDAISFDYLPSVDARKAGEVDHSLEFPQSTVAKVGQDDKAKKKAAPRAYRLRFEAADKQRLVASR